MVYRTMMIDDMYFVISTGDLFEQLKLDVVTAVSLGGGLVDMPTSAGMLSRSVLVTPQHRVEFIERESDDDEGDHDEPFPAL
ncbi:hypothetical protein [Antiquaquibacter soli]|uniref:Uncharacterized protein n=1 Tax=Antiquaquibacter soli TaxID=3064523 RepID=A0ABT9BUJ8_9MICO|nr:hypothetical protein [Protaetiibacter sp. WY-16]MDO7883451.1 hypothetical protein [Protaetiibacter sp. WY-16]